LLKKRLVVNGFPASTTALSLGNGPFLTATLSFLSSRAKPRDLQFRGPLVEMFWAFYWATTVTVTGMVWGGMQELESQAW